MPFTQFIGDDIGRISERENYYQQGLESALENIMADRPLLVASLWLNYAADGMNPFWYKVVNILIHFACGLGVYVLFIEFFRRQKQPKLMALIVACLFVAHPINNQAVNSVIQRGVGLATLFSLLSFWLLIQHVNKNLKSDNYMLSTVCFLMAVSCKPSTGLLPLLFMVYLVFEAGLPFRKAAKLMIPYFVFLAIPVFLYSFAKESSQSAALTGLEYLLIETKVVFKYFQNYLFPYGLHFNYEFNYKPQRFLQFDIMYYALFHLTFISVSVYRYVRAKSDWALMVILGYLALLPESGLFAIVDLAFDHRNYFPMIFFCGAAVTLAFSFARQKAASLFFALAILILAATNASYTSKIDTYEKWMQYNIEMDPHNRHFYIYVISDEMMAKHWDSAKELIRISKQYNPADAELDFLQNLIGLESKNGAGKLEVLRQSFEFACNKSLTTESFNYFEYQLFSNLSGLTGVKDFQYKMNSFYFCFINVVFEPLVDSRIKARVQDNFLKVLELNNRLKMRTHYFDDLSVSDSIVVFRTLVAMRFFLNYPIDLDGLAGQLSAKYNEIPEVQNIIKFAASFKKKASD